MSLEGGGDLINQKSSPQLLKYFHEHNRADILNASGGIFRNRDKPFPFPGGWNVTVLPHYNEAFIDLQSFVAVSVGDDYTEGQMGHRRSSLVWI